MKLTNKVRILTINFVVVVLSVSCNNNPDVKADRKVDCLDKAWDLFHKKIRWEVDEVIYARDYMMEQRGSRPPSKKFFRACPYDSISGYLRLIDTTSYTIYYPAENRVLNGCDSVYCREEARWLTKPRTIDKVEYDELRAGSFTADLTSRWKEYIGNGSDSVLVEAALPVESEHAYYVQFSLFTRFSPEFLNYLIVLEKSDLSLLYYKRYEGAIMSKSFLTRRLEREEIQLLDSLWSDRYSFGELHDESVSIDDMELID